MNTRIKICGIRDIEHARAAAAAGAEMVGLVFHPESPRCVDRVAAERVLDILPNGLQAVAVLRNATATHPVLEWWPGWVQLHGDEDEEVCAAVASRGFTVVRGFACSAAAMARWDAAAGVEYLLLDGANPGSGEDSRDDFGVEDLRGRVAELKRPVLLAGGLTPANVAARVRAVQPWGVDVSSGVERVRGVKDTVLIEAFCRAVRSA